MPDARTPSGPLAGRVVLVTGGAHGLGAVIGGACESAGALVAAPGSADLDVASPDSIRAAVAGVEARLGPIDGLVCNAGLAGPIAPFWEIDEADWAQTLDVDLTGVFRCLAAVVPGMVARGRGSVVTIGSMTGKKPFAGRTAYGAAKLGLVGLVRSAALDAAPHGVRINNVSPGPVHGERLERVLAGRAVEEMFGGIGPVRPDEVAAAVTFLISDAASGVTGEDLNVSAGAVGW